MSKKKEGYTIIIRDADGKELARMDEVGQYLLVLEANKRMDVKTSCNMQWAAYAIKVADTNLNNSLRQAEMEQHHQQQVAAKQGIQTATEMPPGFPGSKSPLRR